MTTTQNPAPQTATKFMPTKLTESYKRHLDALQIAMATLQTIQQLIEAVLPEIRQLSQEATDNLEEATFARNTKREHQNGAQ